VHDPELAGRLPPAAVVFSLAPIWLLPPLLPALVAGGMERLVAFSSTSRFTKAASPEPSERAVAQRLADGEAAAIAASEAAGAAWTLLRPTLIYAEGADGNVSRLARLVRRLGFLPLAGRGEGRRQPVHADDLAVGALAAAAAPAARNRAYELPGGETLTYAEMAARVFEGLGRRPRLVHVPPALWRAGFTLAAPLLPGATGAMGVRMAEDLVFDPEPARRDFGWSPRPFHPDFSGVP
jgi:nucleoside-diphosphate-sugar epimerase